MDTQFLLEEAKNNSKKETTKEVITDESMIVGGTSAGWEIVSEESIEYRRRSSFLLS